MLLLVSSSPCTLEDSGLSISERARWNFKKPVLAMVLLLVG